MAKALLANFLILPLVAWILAQVIPMEESISTGFLLVSVCAARGATGSLERDFLVVNTQQV